MAQSDARNGASELAYNRDLPIPDRRLFGELIPVSRKGSGQKQFIVKKVVHKPEGMAAQVITDVPVNYSKETKVQYETVVIKPDKVKVPVERVH